MEKNSQIDLLEAQIRECYVRAVWSHKVQEKCADILNEKRSKIKMLQIVLSAVITSGILLSVFGDSRVAGLLSAGLSFILMIINTYLKQYDLGGMAQKHADSAIELWTVRESYLSLLTDLRSGNFDYREITTKRDFLQSDLKEIYKGSPRTFIQAYNQASKALKEMDELTFCDEEIDSLLPNILKKKTNRPEGNV